MLSIEAHGGGIFLHQHSSCYNKKMKDLEKYWNSHAAWKAEHLHRWP